MDQDSIDLAIKEAVAGNPREAIATLGPLVRDSETRDAAVFALAYCFEKEGDFSTAAYLLEWLNERHPDFNVAAQRLQHCRERLESRGDSENLLDEAHRPCACGSFQQRAASEACPYCGQGSGGDEGGGAGLERSVRGLARRVEAWASDHDHASAPIGNLKELVLEVSERLRKFGATPQVEQTREKVAEVGKRVSDRVTEIARSEPAQEVARKSRELGVEASERLRHASEREGVVQAKVKVESWGQSAVRVAGAWVSKEEITAGVGKLRATVEGFLAKIQRVIDRAKQR